MRLFPVIDGQISARDRTAVLSPPFDLPVTLQQPLSLNPAQNAYPSITIGGVTPVIVYAQGQDLYRVHEVNSFDSPATVIMTSPYRDSVIRYTFNGKNPTGKSYLYAGPLVLARNMSGTDNTVLKARIMHKNNPGICGRIIRIEFKVKNLNY